LKRMCLTVATVLLALSVGCRAEIVIEHAFCRGGQVFLHWSDPDTQYARYHIYRSSSVIDANTLSSAQLIDSNSPLHSAKDTAAVSAATRRGETPPNRGYRIFDLGEPLNPSDCLKVMSVTQPASHYYAVIGVKPDGTEDRTITSGKNSLASPISEATGTTIPVLDEQGVQTLSGYDYPWKTYTWFKRVEESLFDGEATKVTITLPKPKLSGLYATILNLHAINGTNKVVTWWNIITISPMDCSPQLPYGGNTWWYGYANSYPNVSAGLVCNYTENMLLNMLQWAKSTFPVEPDRVSVAGGSMGGTGALSFGLRHPEIFSGISAVVPQVNPGLPGIGWSQSQLSAVWGSVQNNLPTNDGIGVWDRQNTTAYVAAHTEDLPFIKVQNSKNDETLPWFQVPQFYKNLESNGHGFMAAWGQGGHVNSSTGLPAEYINWDIYTKIRRNQSYPAISNSSVNNNPGSGNSTDGDSVGQMNAGYDWRIITDAPNEWTADIKYTVPGVTPTANISARRLQSFNFAAGDRLAYSLKDTSTGQIIASGYLTASRDRFFTAPDLPFSNEYRALTVRKVAPQTIAEVIDLPEGGQVDLDEIVITAAFADVCYGCAMNRIPAIAILGATGLSAGDVIHLRGTRTNFGNLIAVNANPAKPQTFGSRKIEPLGLTRPLNDSEKPIQLGLLVKVWGVVREGGPDSFVVDCGHHVTAFGNYGARPQAGAYVSVVGIWSKMAENDFGIRLREPADVVVY
jgi:S-formylglutathione hydrolase FrmB